MAQLMCGWPMDGSYHLCYEDLWFPLELWTEDDVMVQRRAESVFLDCLRSEILDDQLLPILHRLQLTRCADRSHGTWTYTGLVDFND